jgi:hypothetical protein
VHAVAGLNFVDRQVLGNEWARSDARTIWRNLGNWSFDKDSFVMNNLMHPYGRRPPTRRGARRAGVRARPDAGGPVVSERRRLPSLLLVALALASAAGPSRADEPQDRWEAGAPRLFLAGRADAGTAQHLGLALGWGKPHWMWGGAEAHGALGLDFASASADLRLALLVADLSVGLRSTRAFRHLPLPDAPRHDAIPTGAGSTSVTLDLFASGLVPTPGGLALWEVNAVRFLNPPPGEQRYEEWLRVVCGGRWCAVARLAWAARLRGGALHLGAGAEWAFADGRSGSELVRLGPVVSWRLWPHLALQGAVYVPVSDPDRLPLLDRVNAVVVLGWTFATGDPPPAFP